MPLRLSCLLSLAVAAGGCSAIINPDDGRLGGPRDAGMAGVDSGITLMDSGPRRDSGTPPPPPVDGGPGCASTEPRCVGDALVTCVSGMEIRQDCQARMAYCEGGECRDWECTPGTRECSSDLRTSIACDARGSAVTEVPCDGICNVATGRCDAVVDRCATAAPVTIGSTHDVQLCAGTDDNTHTPTDGCGSTSRADSADAVFRLEVPTAQTVTIELTDIDLMRAIDTIVYVRRVCDDGSSQVACDDDVPCDMSTVPGMDFCIDGVDVRQSRIVTRLEAGTYYIVVDAFLYTRDRVAFSCGEVRLSVSAGAG